MISDLPEPSTVVDGLHVIALPLPMRVAPVNCYLGRRSDGSVIIIDTGLAASAIEAWTHALACIDAGPEDVSAIFVTHFHPDHIGASRPLSELTGAPVLATATTAEQSPGTWGHEAAESMRRINEHLMRHGMPGPRVGQLVHETGRIHHAVQVVDRYLVLDEGDQLDFAGGSWRVLLTPGHADGHACLFDERRGLLIGGDHLLEHISPAVGRFPGHSSDPLASYLSSLARVRDLPIHLVLPGHGEPFEHAAARCRWLERHHHVRAESCTSAIAMTGSTAWEVSQVVFGQFEDPGSERFATTETLAHLSWLEGRGEVESATGDDGRVLWRRITPC